MLLPDEKMSMIRLISENLSTSPRLTRNDTLHHMSWQVLPSVPEPVHPIYHWIEKNRYSDKRSDEMNGTVARRILSYFRLIVSILCPGSVQSVGFIRNLSC
jgi:hypothetical protein